MESLCSYGGKYLQCVLVPRIKNKNAFVKYADVNKHQSERYQSSLMIKE